MLSTQIKDYGKNKSIVIIDWVCTNQRVLLSVISGPGFCGRDLWHFRP